MARIVPAEDRTAKWNLKYDPARIEAITTAGKPTYSAHASVKFTELAEMEIAVKQVLNMEGTSVAQMSMYLAFSRQVWKACENYSGDALSREVATTIQKWVSRGLTLSVMELIRAQVFNVPPPSAP
jgi:hypothetical protein